MGYVGIHNKISEKVTIQNDVKRGLDNFDIIRTFIR